MPKRRKKDTTLRDNGTFNTRADRVDDPLFSSHDFFDPHDRLQVKYEMLRKVHSESAPVSEAAAQFGFSRPAFYKIDSAFQQGGLGALIDKKRGPRSGHKLTDEVVDWVRDYIDQPVRPSIAQVQEALAEQFGLNVHRRSVQRALKREKKKR